MARRQTIPLADVRAPLAVDDQMTQAEVQAGAARLQTAADLVNVIASQLRLAQGGRGWLQPPSPYQATTGTIDLRDSLVTGERLSGERDGVNLLFRTGRAFINPTLTVMLNGLALVYGADFVSLESGGLGTGWDAVKLLAPLPLLERDALTASYIRAA